MIKGTTMLTRAAALSERKWYVIDAADQVLGRIASEAAQLLRGKHKPEHLRRTWTGAISSL